MKKMFLLISLTLCLAGTTFSQFTFEKSYGSIDDDESYSVSLCSDGGYILAGYTSNFWYGFPDVYVVKTTPSGGLAWESFFGTPIGWERGNSIIEVEGGGYMLLAGWEDEGVTCPWLIRLDANGDSLWSKLGISTGNNEYATSIKQTPDGGYVYCGYSYQGNKKSLFNEPVFLARTDETGNQLWRYEWGGTTGVHSAGDVEVTTDNGYIIAGQYDDPGEYTSAWLIKVNDTGGLQWEKTYGGSTSRESASDVKQTPDGGYVFCGAYTPGLLGLESKVYLGRTDPSGTLLWSKAFPYFVNARATSIDLTDDGGYIISGYVNTMGTNADLYMIRTDAEGDTLWTKTFGGIGLEIGFDVVSTPDGGFVTCGVTESMGFGYKDAYLVKTNEYGVVTAEPEPLVTHGYVNIFPNPCRDFVNVILPSGNISLDLLNSQGTLVKSWGFEQSPGSYQVDMASYPSGLYLMRFVTPSLFRVTRIIKL